MINIYDQCVKDTIDKNAEIGNKKRISSWFTACHDGIAESILAVHFD